jgi:hypothetical protein
MRVEIKSKARNAKYITKVDEYGPTNIVNIAPHIENIIKKPAINIVVSIVVLPKNNKCKPITKSTIPIKIQLS